MLFTFPTKDEDHIHNTFTTYFNYIVNLGTELSSNSRYLIEVGNSKAFRNILSSRKQSVDTDKIYKFLRNAWCTELQLNFIKDRPKLTPYVNHWACVQVYYSIYLAMRSFLIAMDHSALNERLHAKIIGYINVEFDERSDLLPYPWRVICIGDPRSSKTIEFKNTPTNVLDFGRHSSDDFTITLS